ncbi:hypothetical protein QTO12_05950 [Vibrio owensii]|uniref:hypothetical protein n=1 Tax=Vibrio owensii TaxID=696485 RepID=UPI002F4152F7
MEFYIDKLLADELDEFESHMNQIDVDGVIMCWEKATSVFVDDTKGMSEQHILEHIFRYVDVDVTIDPVID